jgi:NRPS condensation-like uncharacterized protein
MTESRIPNRLPASGGDIASDAMRAMLEMVLGSRLVFSGRLDEEMLARAARLLLDLEPVLGCRYAAGPLRAEWIRCSDSDDAILVSVIETGDPDREAAEFHATPFSAKAPRIAAALLRCDDHDELCVRFDHVAGDGWSAKEINYLLAEVYTRLIEDPGYRPAPRLVPRPTHADVWGALTDEQRTAAANTPKMAFSNWSIKPARGARSTAAVRTFTLAPARIRAIREYAHARGATVNEALVTAFTRSVATISPPKRGTRPGVSVSADTRRIAANPSLDRIANIATTQTVLFDYRHGEAFDETLQHVVEGMRPWRDCLWGVGGTLGREASDPQPPKPIVMSAMFQLITALMRVGHAAALVTMNVGVLDERRLTFGDARPEYAWGAGPIPRYAGFAALISSYREAVTFWMGFRENAVAPEVIERCLAGVDEQICAAVLAPRADRVVTNNGIEPTAQAPYHAKDA